MGVNAARLKNKKCCRYHTPPRRPSRNPGLDGFCDLKASPSRGKTRRNKQLEQTGVQVRARFASGKAPHSPNGNGQPEQAFGVTPLAKPPPFPGATKRKVHCLWEIQAERSGQTSCKACPLKLLLWRVELVHGNPVSRPLHLCAFRHSRPPQQRLFVNERSTDASAPRSSVRCRFRR